MEYTQRHIELNAQFQLGIDTHLTDSKIDIKSLTFNSSSKSIKEGNLFSISNDKKINENYSFQYPIFMATGTKRSDKAILLLHGLNERNWNKYLTWAEYLCNKTGKPVILFPIAFHVNRSPLSWTNPRDLTYLLDLRRKRNGEDRSLSFANLIFSERISERPDRFYNSGRQSMNDLSKLISEIKIGLHPYFSENTQIDIFAYSIGAFLAEIMLMTNPKNLFSDSKLFMLCGGGIFSSMQGESRFIMDKNAYEKLFDYYQFHFADEIRTKSLRDKAFESFNSMISIERNRNEREGFFNKLGNRLKGISLVRDKVMPYYGVTEALGENCAGKSISLLDFPFEYSHENPFPVGKLYDSREVDIAFTTVFEEVAGFFC